jgi:hypothetical protein
MRGQQFESTVLRERGLVKNWARVSGGGIPDAFRSGEIWEIKDVQYLTPSQQLRNFLATGKPVNQIVNTITAKSKPLLQSIYDSGGIELGRMGSGQYVSYR